MLIAIDLQSDESHESVKKKIKIMYSDHCSQTLLPGHRNAQSDSPLLQPANPHTPTPPPPYHRLSGLSPGYGVMACQEMPLRGPRDDKISSDQT